MFAPEEHEQINAALRQSLADCMPAGSGGIIAVWDQPEAYQVAPVGDLAVAYGEHRAVGLGVQEALAALADEIRADAGRLSEPHLVGIGLIGHAPVGAIGPVASLLAVIDDSVHQIAWPHAQGQPAWEIKPVTAVEGKDCAAYVAAVADLLDALTGPVEGDAR